MGDEYAKAVKCVRPLCRDVCKCLMRVCVCADWFRLVRDKENRGKCKRIGRYKKKRALGKKREER